MRGGDLVGAYLVTLANPDYPVYIKVPQGYSISPGNCIRAVLKAEEASYRFMVLASYLLIS